MSNGRNSMSAAFQTFVERAPKHAGAWMTAVQALGEASALLVGLPAAGNGITQSLPAAIEAYDAE